MNGVKARRFVWSDPEVQELARGFVAVADEVHSLRTGTTPEARFYQSLLAQKRSHPGHQGVFVASPGGGLLGSCVTWDLERVKSTLRLALEAWRTRTAREEVDTIRLEPSPRVEHLYPEQGLVLRVVSRDLAGARPSSRWSRSFLWFNQNEMMSMLPSDEPGSRRRIPEALARRIAALCLLDKGRVDGFTRAFREAEVQEAWLELETAAGDDRTLDLTLRGRTATRAPDGQPAYGRRERFERVPPARGVRTRIVGHATFDRRARRFIAFEMVAAGARFGGAIVGRPPSDWEAAPIGFSFTLGDGTPAERIAPEFPHRYSWLAGE